MSNMITAFFKGRVGVAEAVYQNDYGIVMNFDSIELPAHFGCYFSTTEGDEAIPGVGADRQVVIPNGCLSRPGNVVLHIPVHTGANDSEVEYVVYFKVIGRARPVDDGTPVQMTAIEQALALLQNPIGNIEQIVNEALAFTGVTLADMQTEFENLDSQFQTAVSALTVDSEVQNIRVGADNVTYTSAGEAVRTQFSVLKSELSDFEKALTSVDAIKTSWVQGYLNSANGELIYSADSCTTDFIDGIGTEMGLSVAQGHKYKVIEYNADSSFSKVFAALTASAGTYTTTYGKKYRIQVTIDSGVIRPAGVGAVITMTLGGYTDKTLTTEGKPADAEATGKLKTLLVDGNQQNLFSKLKAFNGYLNGSGTISEPNSNNKTTEFIEIGNNTSITIQTWMELPTDVTHWQAFCFYDSNKALIGSREVKSGDTTDHAVFTCAIPNTAVYVRASSRTYNDWKIMLQWGDVASAYEYSDKDIEQLEMLGYASDDTFIKSINHRGWHECPENTLIAFKTSKEKGFNYVETDVRATSDGVLVLLHDDEINRTARNLDGTAISGTINIADITYAQALTYDFGIYKGDKYAGTPIPTLAEFLALCKKLALKPYIEIKDSNTIQGIVSALDDYNMRKQATIIGTYYFLRAMISDDYLGIKDVRSGLLAYASLDQTTIASYLPDIKTADNDLFVDSSSYASADATACKNLGIGLEAWTVNSEETIATMDGYISGITSDKLIASSVFRRLI